jgi:hypothetical protein
MATIFPRADSCGQVILFLMAAPSMAPSFLQIFRFVLVPSGVQRLRRHPRAAPIPCDAPGTIAVFSVVMHED